MTRISLSKERLSSEPKSSTKYKDVGWGSGHRHWVVCVYFGNAGLQTAAGELTPVIHHGRSSHKRAPSSLGMSYIGDFKKYPSYFSP